eukprot:PhF_6_TR33711/c0_g1_i1/m.49470/K13148/CPSF3L, INTS11; integrator complex subunit 11
MSHGLRITPLGAGCEVGRSCVVAEMGERLIMFDCGLHNGFVDHRKFPDFKSMEKLQNRKLDVILITHFHLDHVGALPHFCSKYGFEGPILMTAPTLAISRVQLHDYRKVAALARDTPTEEEVEACLAQVRVIALHEVMTIAQGIQVVPYYAGHVLGAVMFHVRVGDHTVLYSGDYNMTADRHLGPAEMPSGIDCDVFITESTYATTVRDSKRQRERVFLEHVQNAVRKGGKVLIPVFALGRAQELCILLDAFWERMSLHDVPIYFSSSVGEKATQYYSMFVSWTNAYVKSTTSSFSFRNISLLKGSDKRAIRQDGAMVLLTTPGMLNGGSALEVFGEWCHDPLNSIVVPGYCVPGTFGNDLLTRAEAAGQGSDIGMMALPGGKQVNVRCSVHAFKFSAHTDYRGILQITRAVQPRNVVLVHGEKSKMKYVKERLEGLGYPTAMPENGRSAVIQCPTKPLYDSELLFDSLETKGAPRGSSEAILSTQVLTITKDGSTASTISKPSLEWLAQNPIPPRYNSDYMYELVRLLSSPDGSSDISIPSVGRKVLDALVVESEKSLEALGFRVFDGNGDDSNVLMSMESTTLNKDDVSVQVKVSVPLYGVNGCVVVRWRDQYDDVGVRLCALLDSVLSWGNGEATTSSLCGHGDCDGCIMED